MKTRDKKRITRFILISLIVSVIVELILTKAIKLYGQISIARLITICGITGFIFSHFTFGFKKVWNIIIDNRYKLSAIMIILSTIIGFFQNQLSVKEWFFTTDVVLSLWWNIKFFALMLVTYELFLNINNENRNISILGTIAVTFSGFIAWNFAYIETIIIGELIIVLLDKILTLKENKKKIICAVSLVISFILYFFTFSDYAITFGYVFLALIIWILVKNREILKKEKNTRILMIITLILSVICAIISRYIFNYNDMNYSISNNQNGFSGLFNYLCNMLLPYNNIENSKNFGSFISVFPVPMLFALYYLYKNEKHSEFLLPITVIAVIESIYCISGFPEIIRKMTFLGNINPVMCIPAVNFANLLIMFYVVENINEKVFKFNTTIRISIAITILLVFIQRPEIFSSVGYLYLYVSELCLLTFLFLNIDDKKYKNVFLFFLITITLIGGVTVNPIIKDKNEPVSHKMEERLVQ